MNKAQVAELENIRLASSDKRLHWQAVVKSARSPKSSLHKEFTWGLRKAAMERWADQARALIQSFTIKIIEAEPYRVRAYVQISPTGGYTPMEQARKSPKVLRAIAYREIGNCLSAIHRINADHVLDDIASGLGALLP